MKHLAWLSVLLMPVALLAQATAPKPLDTTSLPPVRIEHRSDGVFFIDFGRDAFGQLTLHLNHPAGQKITVRLGEKLADANHIDPHPGGSIRFLQTTFMDDRASLPRRDRRLMPPNIGPVMPFRYVELEGLPHGITDKELAQDIRQIAVNYPFDDRAADFSCSDEQLNSVWNLCKYSIKATSYAGIFVDGDRERKPYEADAYIDGLGWYCCTDDLTLPAFTDRYLIDHPTWPTEWSMFSVLCAWNDFLYTGDRNALRAAYPDLKIKSLRSLEREDGLISADHIPPALARSLHLGKQTLKDIVDWPAGERDAYDMRPVNTVVNAFHCRSLQLLARMAAALGNTADAKDFQSAANRSLASFNRELFDARSGLYIDGEGSTHSSEHANMFPLAFGLVPVEHRAKIVTFIKSRGMACSVYGAQFLLDGLFDNGAGNNAVNLMLAPGDRSWRHMTQDVGTTITLEAWDQKFKPNQDWNHAWGAAPANLIPRKVLGIEPLESGFSKALIWPRCAGKSSPITWASGKVPTAKGPIFEDWKESTQAFHLNVELPIGVTAQVCLPPDWGTRVTMDGKTVNGQINHGVITMQAGPGKHAFSITP